ncbi:unnamed protein product [Darwinula stevensoni]|uniref:USP domain-containing protein n=1 Tax=Darwinula stevensoni TaxID=69355 RepID=A0A7R8XCE3_9CRUS|nr:unnamed protein product [Darwinula stevensoni]CAG0893245.1 unnamed protein product [Darwinula stevensoni]
MGSRLVAHRVGEFRVAFISEEPCKREALFSWDSFEMNSARRIRVTGVDYLLTIYGGLEKAKEKGSGKKKLDLAIPETSLNMEIGQILMSMLHAWGLDPDLDSVCETKLGLLRPRIPISYGILSKGGYMCLYLPTWERMALGNGESKSDGSNGNVNKELEGRTSAFMSWGRWELSSMLSTHHLLGIVAIANTLMSMQSATFAPELEFKRRLLRAQVDILARRWQDRCLEVREAAQALLLAELNRIGAKGRKALVDKWASYLPSYTDLGNAATPGATTPLTTSASTPTFQSPPTTQNEATRPSESIGRIEAIKQPEEEYEEDAAEDIYANKRKGEEGRSRAIVEGFGINHALARQTSQALTYLLLVGSSLNHPTHTSLRRAAVDLIGRGFTVWEPYLDVPKTLLGLFELCCDADRLVPSMNYGLPLTPVADTCRTARHALTLLATARPQLFIITLAREVARHNTLQQNAQTLNVNLTNLVVNRAKPEMLRIIETLIQKMPGEVAALIVEVVDIILHCVDSGHLKARGLHEVFPPICRFFMVSHCSHTRRIAVGARNGHLALYELRGTRCQMIPAHSQPITSCAFSHDGRLLASYSQGENRLSFWQTSTGMFGLGNAQTRCMKTYSTPPVPDVVRQNPLVSARLIWVNNKNVLLMMPDGSDAGTKRGNREVGQNNPSPCVPNDPGSQRPDTMGDGTLVTGIAEHDPPLPKKKCRRPSTPPFAPSSSSASFGSSLVVAPAVKPSSTEPVMSIATLENLGNTCFLNSILYALRVTPGLRAALHQAATHLSNTRGERGQSPTCGGDGAVGYGKVEMLILCLHDLFQQMHSKERTHFTAEPIRPIEFLKALKEGNSLYEDGMQQDAHECLLFILDYFQLTGKKMIPKPAVNGRPKAPTTPEAAEDFVTRFMTGEVVVKTMCYECEQAASKPDSFIDICIPIEDGADRATTREDQVQVLMSALKEDEVLSGDNKYSCDTCKHPNEARRSAYYARLPEILVLQVKRFTMNISSYSSGTYASKNHGFMPTPMVLPCFCIRCTADPPPPHRAHPTGNHRVEPQGPHAGGAFTLYAAICHQGSSLGSGHYVAFLRLSHIRHVAHFHCDTPAAPSARSAAKKRSGIAKYFNHAKKSSSSSSSQHNVSSPHDVCCDAQSCCGVCWLTASLPDFASMTVDAPAVNGATGANGIPASDDSRWLKCDDHIVSVLTAGDMEYVLGPDAPEGSPYLLFYSRSSVESTKL